MKKISIGLLRPNTISNSIYGGKIGDENFLTLKNSIELEGILEPLVITDNFFIISGVRRFNVALEIGLKEVPVVISHFTESEVDEYIVISHQQHRIKSPVGILREISIISEKYRLKSGRNPKAPEVVKGKEERKKLQNQSSDSTLSRLREAKNDLTTFFGDENKAWAQLFEMDAMGKSALSIQKEAKERLNKKINKNKMCSVDVPELDDLYKIYKANSKHLFFLEDDSVDCVFCSPPYYKFRDYQTGKGQFGQENSVNEFINNLADVFTECKRLMKPTASLFVNIMDTIDGGTLLNVPGKLKQILIDQGFFFVSEIIWVKENPNYVVSKRPQPCYEYIFHFTKSLDYKYYTDWMTDEEFEGKITYGDIGKNRQLRSFFDYRKNVINTNVANNRKLASLIEEKGYVLTHKATMPFEIPNVGILSTTQVGDKILDCFSGMASTGLAAISNSRYYIGIDNNPEYVELSRLRLNLFVEGLKTLKKEEQENKSLIAA